MPCFFRTNHSNILDVSWQYHRNAWSVHHVLYMVPPQYEENKKARAIFISISLNNAKYVSRRMFMCAHLHLTVCVCLYERENQWLCQAVWVSVCGMLSPAQLMWSVRRAQEKRIELLINIGSHANVHSPINATFKALLFYFNGTTWTAIMSLSILFDLKTSSWLPAQDVQNPPSNSIFCFHLYLLRICESCRSRQRHGDVSAN